MLIKRLRWGEIEAKACSLLGYYNFAIKEIKKPPVPLEFILQKGLGYDYGIKDLIFVGEKLECPNVLGYTDIKNKIVFIDESLQYQYARHDFTLGHEIGHIRLHKRYYQQALAEGYSLPLLACENKKEVRSMEWQADFFSASLLMPSRMFREKFCNIVKNDFNYEIKDASFTSDIGIQRELAKQEVIKKLATYFGVSYSAAGRRCNYVFLATQKLSSILRCGRLSEPQIKMAESLVEGSDIEMTNGLKKKIEEFNKEAVGISNPDDYENLLGTKGLREIL